MKAGGRPLVILLACVVVFLILQNCAGIAAAMLVGRPPAIGLLAGSVSMLGGHGTAIAWAPTFAAQHDISNALEIGVLCAKQRHGVSHVAFLVVPLVGAFFIDMLNAVVIRVFLSMM